MRKQAKFKEKYDGDVMILMSLGLLFPLESSHSFLLPLPSHLARFLPSP